MNNNIISLTIVNDRLLLYVAFLIQREMHLDVGQSKFQILFVLYLFSLFFYIFIKHYILFF